MEEYFLQYVHQAGDNSCLTLINDAPEFSQINNNPLLNYIFKEDRLYYITFSVKAKSTAQSFKLKLLNSTDYQSFAESQTQEVDTFTVPSNNDGINRGYSCIFSPYFQSFNSLIWTLEGDNLTQNDKLILSDVKIYELNKIYFFENIQDGLIRQIVKISILGKPNTHVAINGSDLKIGLSGNLELPHGFVVASVGVASTDEFIINLMYQII